MALWLPLIREDTVLLAAHPLAGAIDAFLVSGRIPDADEMRSLAEEYAARVQLQEPRNFDELDCIDNQTHLGLYGTLAFLASRFIGKAHKEVSSVGHGDRAQRKKRREQERKEAKKRGGAGAAAAATSGWTAIHGVKRLNELLEWSQRYAEELPSATLLAKFVVYAGIGAGVLATTTPNDDGTALEDRRLGAVYDLTGQLSEQALASIHVLDTARHFEAGVELSATTAMELALFLVYKAILFCDGGALVTDELGLLTKDERARLTHEHSDARYGNSHRRTSFAASSRR